MKLRVRYFASIRETLGSEETVEASSPATRLGGLASMLIAKRRRARPGTGARQGAARPP